MTMKKEKIRALPESITLYFDSEEQKSDFLGQLSDGFGENYVDITWDVKEGDLQHATVAKVRVFDQ